MPVFKTRINGREQRKQIWHGGLWGYTPAHRPGLGNRCHTDKRSHAQTIAFAWNEHNLHRKEREREREGEGEGERGRERKRGRGRA